MFGWQAALDISSRVVCHGILHLLINGLALVRVRVRCGSTGANIESLLLLAFTNNNKNNFCKKMQTASVLAEGCYTFSTKPADSLDLSHYYTLLSFRLSLNSFFTQKNVKILPHISYLCWLAAC